MSAKIVFLCAQLCLIKTALSQCCGPHPAVIAESLGLVGATSAGPVGGRVLLQDFPMPPPGLSIFADDLIIEGLVSVSGRLPFLGTVALEGILPTEGHGSVLYGCGNGEVGIVGEGAGPLVPEYPSIVPGYGFPTEYHAIAPGYGFPTEYPAIAPGYGFPTPIAPFAAPCNAPLIDPGMAAAANTAAMAAAASSAGQAAACNSYGLGAAANAAGLTAMALL